MIENIRKRFIVFSVLVISSIIVLIALFIFVGSDSNLPAHRYIISLSLAIILVFIGSWFLSKTAVKPIRAAWQKQLDFTADASHELRTPISVIQTNLEWVMDNPNETIKSQMKWLKNIEAENKRMTKLVEDLLTLSRADTDQQALEFETFMIDEVLAETGKLFEPIAKMKEITVEVCANNSIAYHGDRKRIQQLFVILIDNAINYTKSHGTVTVAINRSENKLEITVSDTGHGMESEHLEKIFDRFYRVTKTRKYNQDGAGLGLAIAKWIVKEHRGMIKVTSTPAVGTTFTVVLS